MNCQVCGGIGYEVFVKSGYNILTCNSCSHFFTDLLVNNEKVNFKYQFRATKVVKKL